MFLISQKKKLKHFFYLRAVPSDLKPFEVMKTSARAPELMNDSEKFVPGLVRESTYQGWGGFPSIRARI